MVQPVYRYVALLAGLLFSLGTGCTTPADPAPVAPAAPSATRPEGEAPAVPATAGAAPTSNSASVAFASFRLRTWTADDGFPAHAADIDQTPDGYLWIATDEGIFRFDGARFVAFTAATVPVFQSDNFLCLDVLPSGDLWVGTRDRWTYRLRNGEWTAYSIDSAFRGRDWVQGFVQDSEGTVWASSAGRSVARFDGTRWMPVEQRIRGHWTPVVADAAGTIWTLLHTADVPGLPTSPLHTRQKSASESVVARWDGEAFTPPRDGRLFGFERAQDGPLFHRLADTDDIPVSIAEVRGRRVLLSDADGAPRGSFVMGDEPRSAKLVDRAGRVWTELLASDGSLAVHVGDAEVARILPEGSRWIEHVFEDDQGNVWVLSSGGSLLQVTPEPFHRFGLDEGAPLSAESAFAAADGTVLVSGTPGAEESPLFRVRGEARASGLASAFSASFSRDGQSGDPTVGLVMQDGRGRAFGTWGPGLFQLDGFQSRMVWKSETGADVRIPFPDAADADALWLGDIEGVLRRFDTEALVMTDSFQVPLPTAGVAWPTDVHRTPDGRLWVASRGGLVVVGEDGHPQPIRALAGVPVRDLADGPDGALWAATETRGLVRIRSGEVDALGPDHGLPTLQLVAVLFDDSGYVWLSGRSLLYRLRVADAGRALDHAAPEPIDIVTLLPSAGHLGSAAVLSRAAKAPDGSFWIPSEKGVTRIDPQMYARQFAEPPPVLIEAVHTQSGEHSLKAEASVRLPQGDRSPTVDYTAIDLTAPDLVRFQTQLVGLDDAWKDQGDARSLVYARLGPGTYTFRVRARNGGGLWTTPVEATLVIPPYFYETWWFAALCALSLLAALILGVRARERTLAARQRHLESVVHERTGQLQAEKDTVAAQAERLETLDAAKSAFFANVSHEFRTPLTLTLGPLDDVLAGEYGPVPDEAASPLALARRSAGRVLDLIGQILDLSRLETGSTPLHARPLDLAAFARAQAETFRPLAAHRRISLSVRASEAPAEVWADPEHVGTVLSNVLSNALKFTPEGGRVTIAVDADAAHVRVSVRDSGPGIAAADLLRVFDRFYQVPHDEGRPLGTGIGLALAHDLARLHGGTLTAESTPGEGSTFTLALPTGRAHLAPHQMHSEPWDGALRSTPVAEAPAAETRASPPGHDNDADDDRTTVLISDDNADIRAYIRRHLEAAGYRVDEAEDGQHALERIAERLPDLVVSDVMMPRLDGLGLCRALRASPETDFVPILLLTAKAAQEDRLDGLAEACDDYLTKPFDVRELVARVDNLIGMRRRLRTRFAPGPAPGDPVGDGAVGDGAVGDGGLRPAPVATVSADATFLDAVRACVEAHLGDDAFSVERLAAGVGLSRAHLHRRLRELAGQAPSETIRAMRLERAAHMLAGRAGTVSEVAYAVGFKSVAHFSNAFTARYGCRPSAYPPEA